MYFQISTAPGRRILFDKAQKAKGFLGRLRGLMFQRPISENEALLFYKAPSIHTFFMRFAIDIIFLNKEKRIMKIYSNVGPGKTTFCKGSFWTIECLGGMISKQDIKEEDILQFSAE